VNKKQDGLSELGLKFSQSDMIKHDDICMHVRSLIVLEQISIHTQHCLDKVVKIQHNCVL